MLPDMTVIGLYGLDRIKWSEIKVSVRGLIDQTLHGQIWSEINVK